MTAPLFEPTQLPAALAAVEADTAALGFELASDRDTGALLRALVAARNLRPGARLAPGDVRLEARELATLPEGWLAHAGDVVGKRLRRSLRQGQPFQERWLEAPPSVERGQIVQLRIQRGPLRIEALGEARGDGRTGDWIRVVNRDSRREVRGRVVGDGVVHVDF